MGGREVGQENCSGLGRIATDEPLSLEDVEMVLNSRARAEADRPSDLANRGGITALLAPRPEVFDDFLLPRMETFGHLAAPFRGADRLAVAPQNK